MLQRHQRNNLDQIVSFARDELSHQLQTLKENSSRTALLSTTAANMLDMLSNISYPLVGLQIIKQNLTNTKHPHSLQVQMILDKAQMFYIESVKHDLNKLKEEQKIQHLSYEDIKEYIQQINWKLGFDRESILNESQQIGDNIDLMKFFQGVRNYQNWQENLEKKTIQKLKKFSINSQNELKLRKGYLIRKIQNIYESQIRDKKEELMKRLKMNSKLIDKLSIFNKIMQRNEKQVLSIINIACQKKSHHQKLQQLCIKYAVRTNHESLVNSFRQVVKKIERVRKLIKNIKKIEQKKQLLSKVYFMQRFLTKKYERYQKLGRSVQKINKILKKIIIKQVLRSIGLPFSKLIEKLEQKYTKTIQSSFKYIKQYIQEKAKLKSLVSQKIKGKILLSIQKYEKKPINLRKTFLDWYLKAKQQKYSKMIYNIWLNGSISKFTFLMRIKNIINEGKKQKIRQELKVFLMVLMQKMGGYYNFCHKGFINRWLQRHRYCKKLTNLINKLCQKVEIVDNGIQKQGLIKIIQVSTKKKNLKTYFLKQIKIKQQNQRMGFAIWRRLPNLKKAKGERALLNFLRQKLNQLQLDQREIYEIFKHNRIEGRQKKLRYVSKVFSRDFAYLASFFNIWRRNIENNRMKNQQRNEKTQLLKQNGTKSFSSQIGRYQFNNIKQSFQTIFRRSKFLKNRESYTLKTFKYILSQSENKNLKNSYDEFKNNLIVGKKKKQKLVCDLVNANKIKQAQSLLVWLTGATVQRQNQKREQIKAIFEKLNHTIRPCLDQVIKQKPLNGHLNRITINYMSNIKSFINKLKTLPPRVNRKNPVRLFNNLQHLIKKTEVKTYEKFKQNNYEGQRKKKKIMSFMYYQYVNETKKYFQMYLKNSRQLKLNDKFNSVLKVFENCSNVERGVLDIFMTGQKIWKKKAQYISKFNFKLNERLRQAIKLWHSTSKAITYFNSMRNQKKSRLLSTLSELLSKNQFSQTKKCIHLFKKNSNIVQLQTNFLKRLCDTQAGKVIKALMIWKNLPKPQNKQLVAKASSFERKLFHFSQKILRTSLNRFKDDQYFGNDKKKQAIRTLVAKSCTGIEKYFDIWKKNNKLITLFSQCHKIEFLMQTMTNQSGKLFRILISGNKSEKLNHSLQDVLKWWRKNCGRMFNIWRNKTTLIKSEQERKKSSLITISKIEEAIEQRKTKRIIVKMRRLLFFKNILIKHFIQRQKLNAHEGIKNMVNLPDRMFMKKQNDKKKSVLQLVDKLGKQVRDDQKRVLQIFRDIKYKGNYKKLKSCEDYLKDKISQVHKILVLWLNMTMADKQKRKENLIQNIFESSFQISRSNFSQILQSIKVTQAKKRSFQKLCQAMEIKKKGLFNIWRSKIKEMKLNQMLDMANKKSILQKINKLISGTSQENVKKVIKNFHLHFKISQVQVKFIQRLLQTKSGKVLQAFNKWKKIPAQNLKQKFKKGHKFFSKLDTLIKSKLTEVNNNFAHSLDQGSTVKKQSVLQLLDITSTGIRRYYNRWIRITKRDHTLKQAYSMMHSLDALQECASQNYKIIFEDPRSTRIKCWAIQKLIQSSGQNVGLYFKKWKQNIHQMKIAQQFQRKEKKTAIQIFTRALGGSQAIQAKEVIRKFYKNLSISNISKNFITRLLKTKSGKVVQLFQLWKSIPDVKIAKKKKKAIKFQSNLNKMFMKFLKCGYEPFKISNHEARNRKRICIQKLIRASMGEEKKKLILWRQIVKQEKMLVHTHLFDSIFERLNNKLSDSIMILVKNSAEEVSKKKSLCRRLINNSSFTQYHAYFIWKEALQVDNVKIQKIQAKVRTNLLHLINVDQKIRNKKIVQVLGMFKKKYTFKTKLAGDVAKQQKNKKAIVFYDKISNFTFDKVGLFLRQLKKNYNQLSFINKNKTLEKNFENMTHTFAQSLQIVIRSNKQTVILENAINQIFNNFKISTQKAFNLWRQQKNFLGLQSKIVGQKKKNLLQILNRSLKNQENIRIPYAISKFQKNYKMTKLMKQILAKILRTKAGKVPLSFMIWKSLPNPGAKKLKQKGMKFQSRLCRLINQGLKITYQKFKQENYEGNNKKKNAVRKLILVTMSGSNRYFNMWRSLSNETKIAQKINWLSKFFETSNFVYRQNVGIFDSFPNQFSIKEASIKRMVKNVSQNLHRVINAWRYLNKEQKCYKTDKILSKFSPQLFNIKLLKDAFHKIKRKSEMEILRTYINSLWKWKVSNVQANYYAKFIKVFKQSQQLIILSNCINKKKYENLHCAFRKIALESLNRHQRKIGITEKYMMRKINNYFQRFKLNACFEEINTWRNMYKSTIKGKKLIELIQVFARKQLYNAFKQIQQIQTFKRNTELFSMKMQNFKLLLIRNAFAKMRKAGSEAFSQKISSVISRITLRHLSESFNLLKTITSVIGLANYLERVSQRFIKRQGFARIHQRSNIVVKCRLAINLISYMEKQKIKNKVLQALKRFKKNSSRKLAIRNISSFITAKEQSNERQFYKILKQSLDKKILLNRFKKGMIIKKILDKQDQKELKRYFAMLKKKENPWVSQSVKRFIVRSDLKSSLAVSLWRLKNYQLNSLN